MVIPEHHLARLGVEPPTLLVRVILESLGKIAEIKLFQIEHVISFISLDPPHIKAGPTKHKPTAAGARGHAVAWRVSVGVPGGAP